MRCAIHTCDWVCWLGIKVSMIYLGRGLWVIQCQCDLAFSTQATGPPLPPIPCCGWFEAKSALYCPLSTNWTLTRAFSADHPHERDISIPTSDIDTTWAFGRVLMSVFFHKRPLCCVSCLSGASSVGGESTKLRWRDGNPSLRTLPTPAADVLKPDLYMLFGQTVDLTDIHNVVLGQPAGILKPQSCYVFFFSFLNNQSGTIL